ncbi:hypothetical protein D3C84_1214220 [compost metagenome]
MHQQDFIDNSRKGVTIRNLTKRDLLRERRAKLKAEKGEQSSDLSEDEADDDDSELDEQSSDQSVDDTDDDESELD